jgi:hypothetical protein
MCFVCVYTCTLHCDTLQAPHYMAGARQLPFAWSLMRVGGASTRKAGLLPAASQRRWCVLMTLGLVCWLMIIDDLCADTVGMARGWLHWCPQVVMLRDALAGASVLKPGRQPGGCIRPANTCRRRWPGGHRSAERGLDGARRWPPARRLHPAGHRMNVDGAGPAAAGPPRLRRRPAPGARRLSVCGSPGGPADAAEAPNAPGVGPSYPSRPAAGGTAAGPLRSR